ncbi:MAG: hypothetical protein GKS06_15900 [Acidobacteria bacterium]|nr:hypothetical protein [Acidobacteriota bacterium]
MSDIELRRRRLRLALLALAWTVVGTFVAWLGALGWMSATVLTAGASLAFIAHIRRHADSMLRNLWICGLAAGFGELASDYWAAVQYGYLVYPAGEPMIWASPLYMPFAWAVIVVQLGVIGFELADRFGLGRATLATGIIGGINVPIYEYLAKGADLWYCRNCWMLAGTTPYWIIVFEVLFALPLAFLARKANDSGPVAMFAWGVALAIWMWVGLIAAVALVGQAPTG